MKPWPFHPRQRTLVAFALGDLANRSRVARHLESCSDCRQFVGFTQRLSNASGALPPESARADILERALADRANGARMILTAPTTDAGSRSPRAAVRAILLVAASMVIGIATVRRLRSDDFRADNQLLLAGLAPKSAEAAQGGTTGGPLTHRLRAMSLTFNRRIIDSTTGGMKDWGSLDLRVSPGAAGQGWTVISAWRDIAHVTDMENARIWAETLAVADSSLRPIRRLVHVAPYRRWAGISIHQFFRGDSVVGQMSLDQDATRREIRGELGAIGDRLIASDPLAPLWLMGVPLVQGSVVDARVLGWFVVPNKDLTPIRLAVIGSERIVTPAGTFDCWKMTVTVGRDSHLHWVRKSDHLGVLTRRRLPNGTIREVILTREGT
jgi:hypothetical protein